MSFLDEAKTIKSYTISRTLMEGHSLAGLKAKFAALPDEVPAGKRMLLVIQVELRDMEVE